MKKETTAQTIADREKYAARYSEALSAINELLTALSKYEIDHPRRNTINAHFFKLYFTLNNGYRDYLKYKLADPRYNFEEGKRLYLAADEKIELASGAPSLDEFKATLKEAREKYKKWKSENENKIKALKAFDEQAFYADLEMLYKKHGKPENWRNLLENAFYKFS